MGAALVAIAIGTSLIFAGFLLGRRFEQQHPQNKLRKQLIEKVANSLSNEQVAEALELDTLDPQQVRKLLDGITS
jgi:hypothetical protein